jgi:hypothetical protein
VPPYNPGTTYFMWSSILESSTIENLDKYCIAVGTREDTQLTIESWWSFSDWMLLTTSFLLLNIQVQNYMQLTPFHFIYPLWRNSKNDTIFFGIFIASLILLC